MAVLISGPRASSLRKQHKATSRREVDKQLGHCAGLRFFDLTRAALVESIGVSMTFVGHGFRPTFVDV